MTYWRMQLHPDESSEAIRHTVESLSAGYIGLDFAEDIPDMSRIQQSVLPERHRNYYGFFNEMAREDWVLLFAHHYPFALVQVDGDYNYIHATAPEIGVWFRHFRKIKKRVRYYGDYRTDAQSWVPITMAATITPLRETTTASYQLINRWLIDLP